MRTSHTAIWFIMWQLCIAAIHISANATPKYSSGPYLARCFVADRSLIELALRPRPKPNNSVVCEMKLRSRIKAWLTRFEKVKRGKTALCHCSKCFNDFVLQRLWPVVLLNGRISDVNIVGCLKRLFCLLSVINQLSVFAKVI